MKYFFIVWTILFIVSIVLICVRDGIETAWNIIVDDTLERPVFWAIFSVILYYCYLPFTIPNVIKEIKEDNEKNRKSN